ncbi:MAG TPA: nicotinate-nucleotide adenylyltransferase [Flavobacteriales bacterium]|nr:nicotinate-nucleotide adenylyltransferase [Flavobacteriales bacterium]
MTKVAPSPKRKALSINLDSNIYGTFSEIGAGQEVVRHFFRAGGASGTIAKAMSAYDKDFSDAIYGKEKTRQYVCESRLKTMIRHEYRLMEERLNRDNHPNTKFFSYANTCATVSYDKSHKGHGWMGIRYQLDAATPPNEIVLHFNLKDVDASQQQEVIGLLGLNVIYACYNYYDPVEMVLSLYDNLDRDRLEIDMINIDGPDFLDVDNRLLSLQLVKNGMTDVVMFGPDGHNLHPSEVLYKKNILALRGSFRPVTKVNLDMLENGFKKFIVEPRVEESNVIKLFEITLNNLKASGDIDEQDFLDRAELMCSMGYTVLISNYQMYFRLIEYFSKYTKARLGLIIGVNSVDDIFNEKYYRNLNGGILEAFGILFTRDLKMYLYPFQENKDQPLMNSKNIRVHPRMKPLYDYLITNGKMVDLEEYNPEYLSIFSREVLEMIKKGEKGWEKMVPDLVAQIIKEKMLFGYDESLSIKENV